MRLPVWTKTQTNKHTNDKKLDFSQKSKNKLVTIMGMAAKPCYWISFGKFDTISGDRTKQATPWDLSEEFGPQTKQRRESSSCSGNYLRMIWSTAKSSGAAFWHLASVIRVTLGGLGDAPACFFFGTCTWVSGQKPRHDRQTCREKVRIQLSPAEFLWHISHYPNNRC